MKSIKQNARKKNQRNIYADINWEKAKVLFLRPNQSRESKSGSLQVRDVLKILATAAGIGMIFIFPGAASVLGSLILGKRSYTRWEIKRMFSRLEKQKYIEIEYLSDGKVRVKITKNGLHKALTYELESMQIKKPKRWDGKWRVVTFDIPNKYKRVRDIFRMRLRQLGLYQFQESVYVSPYACFDEIEFLREIYGVAVTVRYLLVEKIEDDSFLQSYFNLQ